MITKIANRISLELLRFGNEDKQLSRKIIKEGITYLEPKAIQEIIDQVKRIESNEITGVIIETGVAKGGSAILLAKYKSRSRRLKLYDTYDMIPPPDENDGKDAHDRYNVIKSGKSKGIKGKEYYGYVEDLISLVKTTMKRYVSEEKLKTTKFLKGFFEETLIVNEEVAMAHIDCDWYSSVMCCLERIAPHLSIGGVLIIDDYHAYSGCKKAVDEYFHDKKADYNLTMKSRLHITRV